MTVAKARGLRKKRSGFDIEKRIFHQDNTVRDILTIDFIGYERLWYALTPHLVKNIDNVNVTFLTSKCSVRC